MSEAIALCHNKSHAECKLKMKSDVTQFEMDWLISITTMDFLFHDLAGEAHEEECCDIPYTVMTLIKKNGIGTLSQHLTIMSRHKEQRHQMNSIATKDNYVTTRKW